MNGFRRHRRRHEVAELNITAFMNLMVILVPFLLITAVFSRMTILELNLPGPGGDASVDDEPQFVLEVTVRDARIEVGDRNTGLLRAFDAVDGDYPLDALAGFLLEIKARHPDKAEATLLLEPQIDYDTVVQVMDRVRVARNEDGSFGELFPDISVGDATVVTLTSALVAPGAAQ